MEVIYLLIPLMLLLLAILLGALFWATHNGQFDDLEGPAYRILQDDDSSFTATTHSQAEHELNTPSPDPIHSHNSANILYKPLTKRRT